MTIFDGLRMIWGLALFLFGMSVMGSALEKSAGSKLELMLGKLTGSPLAGLLTGMGVTAVIQSSSATTVMVVGFVNSGLMTLKQSIHVIMGSNIGTTVTAQLAALTTNRVAKQAALANTLSNIIGVSILCLTFLIRIDGEPAFFALISWIGGGTARQIANAHTVFNVLTTAILLPFIPILAKICEKVIPVSSGQIKYQYLEPHLLDTPSIALTQTAYALRRMLQKAWRMIDCALSIYNRNDEKNQAIVRQLEKREEDIDERQKNITDYLSQLMGKKLSRSEAAQIPLLLHCTNDVERIGDHTEIIQGIIEKMHSSNLKFSMQAEKEYDLLHDKLAEVARLSSLMLAHCTPELLKKSAHLEVEVYDLLNKFEREHITRINRGDCRPQVGILYLELLSEIRKISRHLFNINERSEMFYDNSTQTSNKAKH